jgi:hypothetical protein
MYGTKKSHEKVSSLALLSAISSFCLIQIPYSLIDDPKDLGSVGNGSETPW